MSRTFEIPPALTERISHTSGLAPAPTWVQPEDPATIVTRNIGEWFKQLSEAEILFKKHVYTNEDINDSDIRQHRIHLCTLLAAGEVLAMNILIISEQSNTIKETKPLVEAIDQKLKHLYKQLFEFHGEIDLQSDVPESFKQAVREASEGKLEDMEF